MAGKNKGAIDPVAIRELISQGIPMKKKESEMIPPPTVEEEEEPEDALPLPETKAEDPYHETLLHLALEKAQRADKMEKPSKPEDG